MHTPKEEKEENFFKRLTPLINESMCMNKNLSEQRRQAHGITYFERATIDDGTGALYQRFAIQTHFIQPKENHVDLAKKYVLPLAQEGDILSCGAKVMGLAAGNVYHREDMRLGFFAKLLYRFGAESTTGLGVRDPYKLQVIINEFGLHRVLLGAFLSALTKPFGIRGVFYKVVGEGAGAVDGFYADSSFDTYKDMAVVNPKNGVEMCDQIVEATNIPTMIMDANDFDANILSYSTDFPLSEDQIHCIMRDNPSGQEDELTPFILLRKLK